MKDALSFERRFTLGKDPGGSVFDMFDWKRVDVEIQNQQTGETLYSQAGCEFPAHYSQTACEIIASKYFYRALPETSLKQTVDRMVRFWVDELDAMGVFENSGQREIVYDELAYSLLDQMWAPNSPQWFNTGIKYFGVSGDPDDLYYYSPELKKPVLSSDRYTRSQTSACFILDIKDRLLGPGSISDHYVNETKLFKGGSGVGTNFSPLRAEGERLSSGGTSSGLMSYLEGFDRNAGAIKSGGTTRRAAKMVIVDIDHPEIFEFVEWKAHEEKKAKALIAAGYDGSIGGEAYATVSGQNSNNSVRVGADFMEKLHDPGAQVELTGRVDDSVNRTVPAADLWEAIARAAWECGDPAVQFDDRFNEWNTCAADGRINATNPCSEFAFLDNSACNLASINVYKFFDPAAGSFDVDGFTHMVALAQLVLDASIEGGQFPTPEVAENSYKYRPTGLGLTNLASLLLSLGIPYDSDEARGVAAAVCSLMTGWSYRASAELAGRLGAFENWERNREPMKAVIEKHWRAARSLPETGVLPEIHARQKEVWGAVLESADSGFRNAQVTVMAPTGTISFAMDCGSTGIEPFYSHTIYKKCADGSFIETTNPLYDPSYPKDVLATANEISPEGHVRMVAAIQPFISGAVSKTVNLPNSATPDDIKRIYELAYDSGCKSIAIYRDGSKGVQPLTAEKEDENLDGSPEEFRTFGERLKHLRKSKGLTQPQLAEQSGVSLSAIGKYERDEREPKVDCIRKIAKVLDVSPLDLIEFEESRTFGERLKYLRKKNGLTQPQLAEQSGVSLSAIRRYENSGREPKTEYAVKLAKALNVNPSKMLGLGYYAESENAGIVESELSKRPVPEKPVKPEGIRDSRTHSAKLGDIELYITVGFYPDGRLCELFVSTDRDGTVVKGLLASLSKTVSHLLQYNVSPQSISKMLRGQKYEPAGIVTRHPNIKFADSISDLISKVLDIECGDYSRCQIAPEAVEKVPRPDPGERLYGEICPECGSDRLVKSGTCKTCLDCGATTGCG